MTQRPILLQVLVQQRQLMRYGMFRAAYESAAKKVDRELVGTAPSRAQLHRWISGGLKRLPHTDHCRVLQRMFPGWTADQLFGPCPDDLLPVDPARPADGPAVPPSPGMRRAIVPPGRAALDMPHAPGPPLSDVAAVFTTRAEFTCAMPPQAMFDDAEEIRAAGLSLNLLCQQYPDQRLRRLVANGARLECLFLDPDGEAIRAREREEGYTDHFLSTLTKLNIEVLSRVRDHLPADARDRLSLAVYDETIRFGIVLIDGTTCVMQPYLPQARGVDSPTFLLRRDPEGTGLYNTFEQIYRELSERSRPV
ncbi:DUF5919 domain-containing protein [Actinoallomurus rhizosphaericola]|uniref:DUF5919 domain-containing protein n=1 Tax=Actinoallomurus rhizosphaericola TaxID=2952536 RepID=UPI0020937ECB|nr:DUF5919 domain-containing protein [Actinoallomurus rhizosphaericola]MCO5998618.1 DUF5919 domain-containing protein [Actinoallomurus rhizosphaericola]